MIKKSALIFMALNFAGLDAIYQTEKQLAERKWIDIQIKARSQNPNDMKQIVNDIEQQCAINALDKAETINYVLEHLDAKINYYNSILSQGKNYSKAIKSLSFSGLLAAFGGLGVYLSLKSAGKPYSYYYYSHPYYYHYSHDYFVEMYVGSIFSLVGSLALAIIGVENIMDNKYPEYYLENYKQVKTIFLDEYRASSR